jgi:hypothetical protein
MFWIIVLNLTTATGQAVPLSGPPVAFIDPAECNQAVKITDLYVLRLDSL